LRVQSRTSLRGTREVLGNEEDTVVPGLTFLGNLRKLAVPLFARVQAAGILHYAKATKQNMYFEFDGGSLGGEKKFVVCGAVVTDDAGKKSYVGIDVRPVVSTTDVEEAAAFTDSLKCVADVRHLSSDRAVREGSPVTIEDFEFGGVTDGGALGAAKALARLIVRASLPGLEDDKDEFEAKVNALVDNCLHHVLHNAFKAAEAALDVLRGFEVDGTTRLPAQSEAIHTMMKTAHKVKVDADRAGNTRRVKEVLKQAKAAQRPHTQREAALSAVRPQRQVGGRFGVTSSNAGFLVLIMSVIFIILQAKAKYNGLDDAISAMFRSKYRKARLRLTYYGHFYIYLPTLEVLKAKYLATSYTHTPSLRALSLSLSFKLSPLSHSLSLPLSHTSIFFSRSL
jgi:hypothetical protein